MISPAGTIFVAWGTREPGSGQAQVHLRRRATTSTLWEEFSGSDQPGGLIGIDGSFVSDFSLAVGDDDPPVVAFHSPPRSPGIAFPVPGNVTGSVRST